MADILEYAPWFLVSSVKFFLTPLSMAPIYGFWPTVLVTISGGWTGVLAFHYFGNWILAGFAWLLELVRTSGKPRKKFTRINKTVVKVKSSFGLWGIALLTPSLFSIPLGVLISVKYYGQSSRNLPPFLISIVLWSLVLTSFSKSIKQLLTSIGWL